MTNYKTQMENLISRKYDIRSPNKEIILDTLYPTLRICEALYENNSILTLYNCWSLVIQVDMDTYKQTQYKTEMYISNMVRISDDRYIAKEWGKQYLHVL